MSVSLLVIGLNHSTAPVEVRERISFPGDQDGKVTGLIADVPGVEEAMILSTCNRAEIIVTAEESAPDSRDQLIDAIGSIHGVEPKLFRDFCTSRRVEMRDATSSGWLPVSTLWFWVNPRSSVR